MRDYLGRAAPVTTAARAGGMLANVNSGVWVAGELSPSLGRVRNRIPMLWEKLARELRFTQGYSATAWGGKGVGASNGTHDTGHALDLVTGPHGSHPRLTNAEIRQIARAFEAEGFAAPFRPIGYDMGSKGHPLINKTEHIHAVYTGHANYAACWASTHGGKASIEAMLARRYAG